jgi:hypothetical protein
MSQCLQIWNLKQWHQLDRLNEDENITKYQQMTDDLPGSKGQQRQGNQYLAHVQTAVLEQVQKKTSGSCDTCEKTPLKV